jgi:hypothetical protein
MFFGSSCTQTDVLDVRIRRDQRDELGLWERREQLDARDRRHLRLKVSMPPLIDAHARGIPFIIITPAGLSTASHPIAGLMVAKDSPIKTAADLNGKMIAVGSLNDIFTLKLCLNARLAQRLRLETRDRDRIARRQAVAQRALPPRDVAPRAEL